MALLGDPKVLMQDVLSDPDKYEEEVFSLTQDLASGRRAMSDLKEHEMQLLDRATIDFTQPRRIKQEARPEPPPPKPKELKADEEDGEPAALPPEMASAYWWLK